MRSLGAFQAHAAPDSVMWMGTEGLAAPDPEQSRQDALKSAQTQFQQWATPWAQANLRAYPDITSMQDDLGPRYQDSRIGKAWGFLDPSDQVAREAFESAIHREKALPAEPVFRSLSLLLEVPSHGREEMIAKLVTRYSIWPQEFVFQLEKGIQSQDPQVRIAAFVILKEHPSLPDSTLSLVLEWARRQPNVHDLEHQEMNAQARIAHYRSELGNGRMFRNLRGRRVRQLDIAPRMLEWESAESDKRNRKIREIRLGMEVIQLREDPCAALVFSW